MKVILTSNIKKLGKIGDLVTVKDGYARNFLFPQKKALRASENNLSYFEKERVVLEAKNLECKNYYKKMDIDINSKIKVKNEL